MEIVWKPEVTVAALIERDGRFLFVEEETRQGVRLNQPAGHLEAGETLVEAAVRETLEETAHRFAPEFLVGIYSWPRPDGQASYLRFAFGGRLLGVEEGRALDTGILRALWLTPAELDAAAARQRSPLVRQAVTDHLAGRRYPLDLIRHC